MLVRWDGIPLSGQLANGDYLNLRLRYFNLMNAVRGFGDETADVHTCLQYRQGFGACGVDDSRSPRMPAAIDDQTALARQHGLGIRLLAEAENAHGASLGELRVLYLLQQ